MKTGSKVEVPRMPLADLGPARGKPAPPEAPNVVEEITAGEFPELFALLETSLKDLEDGKGKTWN